MAIQKKTTLTIDHRFDPRTCRHELSGTAYVLHCHHYATLYCQLADDAELFDGKALLRKAAALAFYDELVRIFRESNAQGIPDRVSLAEQYWKFTGMGLLELETVGAMGGAARMPRSHVDEGWIKKWGKREKPVNFIGQGFLAAAFEAIFDLPVGSFRAEETASIVAGAAASQFKIVRA
jgi:hypothetical protein